MTKHEYRIVLRSTPGDLAIGVEDFLNAGWQLVGGVCVGVPPDRNFYQAITRSWNPVPPVIGKVITNEEEVLMYSEN